MFSFKDVQEEVSTGSNQYVKTGINDVKIIDLYYQPTGPSIKPDKKDSAIDKAIFVLETKEGAKFDYDVLVPKDDEQSTKMMKRLMHFLSKTGKTSEIDSIKTKLQTLEAKDFEDLVNKLSKVFIGKSVRVKVVGSYPNRNFPSIPNFLSGWAECIDVNPTQLKYDETSEGLVRKDSSKVETTTSTTSTKEEIGW